MSDAPREPELASRLAAAVHLDAEVRERLARDGSLFEGYHPEMEAVHRANARLVEEALAVHGWPGRSLVGEEAARAAWLIAQHAIGEPAFMRACLARLEEAVANGEAPAWQAAMLEDRIRALEGRTQRYGVVLDWDDTGRLSPVPPVEDDSLVEELRASVGLPPLAETLARRRAEAVPDGDRPPPDLEAHRRAADEWARRVGWRDPPRPADAQARPNA